MGVHRLSPWGPGVETYYLPKQHQKILYSSKKVKNQTILADQGVERAHSCPSLRTSMNVSEVTIGCLASLYKPFQKYCIQFIMYSKITQKLVLNM